MKRRNPFAVFVLSLVTLGIYDIYWLVVTRKELNDKTRTKVPTIWLLFAPAVVLFLAVIALLILGHGSTGPSYGTGVQTSSHMSPATGIGFAVVWLLTILLVLPISFYWFFKFSKSVNEYTSGKMSTGVTFLLLWMLHLIGVAIVQDAFNDMLDAGAQVATPTPAVDQTPPITSVPAATTAPAPAAEPTAPAETPAAAPEATAAPEAQATTPAETAEANQGEHTPPTGPVVG